MLRERWARAVVVIACATIATGCASAASGHDDSRSPSSAVSAPTGPQRAWAAVFQTAADPQDLSAPRAEILAGLGDALDGYVVVSPSSCIEGLPAGISGDGYVLAILREQRGDVRALAGSLDQRPVFVGPVTVTCTD